MSEEKTKNIMKKSSKIEFKNSTFLAFSMPLSSPYLRRIELAKVETAGVCSKAKAKIGRAKKQVSKKSLQLNSTLKTPKSQNCIKYSEKTSSITHSG